MNVDEADRILLDTLRKSLLLQNKGGPSAREGMMQALNTICLYLHARGVSGQQIKPLVHLHRELESIWEGQNRSS